MRTILIGLGLCMIAGQAQAYSVEMTQEELQEMVAAGFPIEQQMPFITAVFSDPRIHIVTHRNRLRLSVAIKATFSNNATSTGRAELEGELGYDSGKGEFHLRQPTVTELQFDQLPQQYEELVSTVVNTMAQQTLPIIVIYRLDERDFKQSMARSVLKSVNIRNGKLIAEMGW